MRQRIACNIRTIGNMIISLANRIDNQATQTSIQTTVQNTANGVHITIEIDQTKRQEKLAQIESECDLAKIRELGRKARAQRKMELETA